MGTLFLALKLLTSNVEPVNTEIIDTSEKILLVSPRTSESRAKYLARIINRESKAIEVDPDILVVILRQESNFRNAAINSYIIFKNKACFAHSDLGISQVSEDWVDRWSLDRDRLINDDSYNIHIGAKVLKGIKKQFGDEPNFWSRYNSSKDTFRQVYEDKIIGFLALIDDSN
jgi:hypothetical protein